VSNDQLFILLFYLSRAHASIVVHFLHCIAFKKANNRLQGTIPPEIALLSNLRVLNLSEN